MKLLLLRIMSLAPEQDWGKRWQEDLRRKSLLDVRMFAVIITILLCVLALAVVMFVVAKILEKKNDYGDEDEMHMQRAKAFPGSVDARLSVDIASGSVNCMKHFTYQDISRR